MTVSLKKKKPVCKVYSSNIYKIPSALRFRFSMILALVLYQINCSHDQLSSQSAQYLKSSWSALQMVIFTNQIYFWWHFSLEEMYIVH